MSDDKLRDRTERGFRAKNLLGNDDFVEITRVLRDELFRNWELAQTTETREHAWHGVSALRTLVAKLHTYANDGTLAQREIEALDKPSSDPS